MKVFLILAAAAVFLAGASSASAFGGCEEDCGKCHFITEDETMAIFKKMKLADAKLIGIKMSQIRGLWEATFENMGNRGIMYIGFSKKFVIGGSIYEVDTASNKTLETLNLAAPAPERYADVSKISLADALVLGNRSAKHKVVVFTDPDCPYCAKLHQELKKALIDNKDIAFFLKLLPLKMHPDAYWKSKSIMCKKSVRLLEENFEKKPIQKTDCDSKTVDETMKTAQELGITGTPTMVMPDGLIAVGIKDSASIIELILKHEKKEGR